VKDISIGHPNNAISKLGEFIITDTVFGFIMRVAIDFDDQTGRRARKVGDVVTDHILTTELSFRQFAVRQIPPQTLFWLRWITTHFCGMFLQLGEALG
jgi:hypothetical protein